MSENEIKKLAADAILARLEADISDHNQNWYGKYKAPSEIVGLIRRARELGVELSVPKCYSEYLKEPDEESVAS